MKQKIKALLELAKQTQQNYCLKKDVTVDLSKLICEIDGLFGELENYKSEILTQNNPDFSEDLKSTEEINKVAFFLARYEHKDISKKCVTHALSDIANVLGIKATTLRNKRDLFAPIVRELKEKDFEKALEQNPRLRKKPIRKGWGDPNRPLPPGLQDAYNECFNKPHDVLLDEVKDILGIKKNDV